MTSVIGCVLALSMSLSAQEQRELQRLLSKAKAAAADSLSSEEFTLVPVSEAPGAMTDGSKRRDFASEEPSIGKKKMTSYAGSGSAAAPAAIPAETFDIFSLPSPSSTEGHLLVELPPQVPDVETWGRTLLQFGKHAVRKLTYAQFMSSTDPDIVGYRKWAWDRRLTCTGLKRDFTNYMVFCESLADNTVGQQQPVIPGTNHVRRFG